MGVGSTFCFTVNLERETQPRTATEATYHEFSDLRTLVVDDNATNRLLLRRLLEQWHLRVDEAASGSEALDLLREQQERGSCYDIVLIDRRMPAMDGFDTAEHICHNPQFRSPVVLMLASDTQVGDLARARRMGIHATLIKPIKSGKLASALQKALDENCCSGSCVPSQPASRVEKPRGTRILVAEDSEDNRFLISAYLEPEGFDIYMVEDGTAAVESATADRYDIILMDVQMPKKDGYTATREIRAYEAEHELNPVPIIALTAHALKGEEASALAAGCSAYLAKPISKPKLEAELQKHLRKLPGPLPPQTDTVSVLPEIQARIPSYLARGRQELQLMRDLIEVRDFERIRVLAHNMKGSGAGYGFPELSRLGAQIEQSAQRQKRTELEQQTSSLEALLAVFGAKNVTAVF